MKVTILCGVSGSGKSTYIENHLPDASVVSADNFFMRDDGDYLFDPTRLGEAHGTCLRQFVMFLTADLWDPDHYEPKNLVVDNTNTTVMEVAPYAQLAIAYGYELEIIILEAEPGMAHSRNTHGVPLTGVMGQHDRLVKLAESLPPWWPTRKVDAKFVG